MNLFKKIFLSLLFLSNTFLYAQKMPDRPNPPRLVNDFTNTLTPDQIQTLEKKLVDLDNATSTQIAVVLVPNTDGVTISDYNVELLRKWGVGTKKDNNGVVLLIAKDDRKLDIAVGYGLEGALPDATAKSIIDDVIVPSFKGNDYYRGIDQGTDAIVQAVKGQYNAPRPKSSGKGGSSIIFFIIVVIVIIIISSGGGRKGGGTFMSRRGQTGIADAVIWSLLLGGGGRGGGGGGGWGGGGGEGGFGGFGGGGGGGGGASGSW